jgi:hypothetical protein
MFQIHVEGPSGSNDGRVVKLPGTEVRNPEAAEEEIEAEVEDETEPETVQ